MSSVSDILNSINKEISSARTGIYIVNHKRDEETNGANRKFKKELSSDKEISAPMEAYESVEMHDLVERVRGKIELDDFEWERLINFKLWLTQDHRLIKVSDMLDEHIFFTVRMLKPKVTRHTNYYSRWIEIFNAEMDKRFDGEFEIMIEQFEEGEEKWVRV